MVRPTGADARSRERREDHQAPDALLENFSERVRANSDLMTKMSAIVARAGQVMAARQAAAVSEAIDDLTRLMRETLSETGNPAAISRAHAAYAETVFRRSLRHLQLSLQNLAELSASALELADRRADAEPPPDEPVPRTQE